MLKACEPYFRFWRIFVVESWGADTVTIDYGRFYGRADGVDLLDSAIGGFASDGFPSFDGWSADLDEDGTAYVGAEWEYPIAPRLFEMIADAADRPKTFQLQCSNDNREWFQFGDDYTLPEPAGGAACTVFTLEDVISQGPTQSFDLTCDSEVGTEDELNGCDILIYYAHLDAGTSGRLAFSITNDVTINYKIYQGQWPDLELFDEFDNVQLLASDPPFEMLNNFGGEFFFTIAIQGYDSSQNAGIIPEAQANC